MAFEQFWSIQFSPIKNVEKLLSLILAILYTLRYLKRKLAQYPKTNSSFTIKSSSPAALYNDDQSIFLTGLFGSGSMYFQLL
jgi:hypothetical protein